MKQYQAFGHKIESEIPIPEFLTDNFSNPPDITIRIGPAPAAYDVSEAKYHWSASSEHFFFKIFDVAKFFIADTKSVLIDPAPGCDMARVRVFLLGTCFGVLLHKMGFFPLHGSTIATHNEECVVFVGPVGAGKSTTVTAFGEYGYKILADDISAISLKNATGTAQVLPSYPQTKLCRDSAYKLNKDPNTLQPAASSVEKFRVNVTDHFIVRQLPLKLVIALHSHSGKYYTLERVTGQRKFDTLLENTYRNNMIGELGLTQSHFQKCCELSNNLEIIQLNRPKDDFSPANMIAFLRKELEVFE